MLRVLVVDDARLYLDGLSKSLKADLGVEHIATATDTDTALRQLIQFSPHVVLLNTAMLGRVEAIRSIARSAEDAAVIALGVNPLEEEIVAYAEAGVAGYLLKDQSLGELMTLMRSVAQGETLCPPQITATLLRRVSALAVERQSPMEASRLTARENEILRLLEQGQSNKEIARSLSIEVRTVKNHVHNILQKLQVHRRGEAVARVQAHRVSLQYRPDTDGRRYGLGMS